MEIRKTAEDLLQKLEGKASLLRPFGKRLRFLQELTTTKSTFSDHPCRVPETFLFQAKVFPIHRRINNLFFFGFDGFFMRRFLMYVERTLLPIRTRTLLAYKRTHVRVD